MSEVLTITTEEPNVVLRAWSSYEDDMAYFEAVDEDREHLSHHGDATARKYPNVKEVKERRLDDSEHIRLGIWDENSLKGSITAKPDLDKSEVEIGYWLRASATGNGYATIAVKPLTAFLNPTYRRVFAEVHIDNSDSAKVLQRAGYIRTGVLKRDWGSAIVFEAAK